WQYTGVFFNNGERVEVIVISGRWAYAQDQFLTNGEGDTNYICSHLLPSPDCTEPLPEAPKGALIGKIGNMIFEIGEQVVVIAQDTGYLELRINDEDYGLSDNIGSLEINILK
ncbi:MAG: hypothetical protein JNJ43_18285, partial [Anaerolineales bacterium]|nr:hypothetical protein [Anaerolineales bacterium]